MTQVKCKSSKNYGNFQICACEDLCMCVCVVSVLALVLVCIVFDLSGKFDLFISEKYLLFLSFVLGFEMKFSVRNRHTQMSGFLVKRYAIHESNPTQPNRFIMYSSQICGKY